MFVDRQGRGRRKVDLFEMSANGSRAESNDVNGMWKASGAKQLASVLLYTFEIQMFMGSHKI